jgi:Raf kinase inhibitor-like YbhB/YbcL family protein
MKNPGKVFIALAAIIATCFVHAPASLAAEKTLQLSSPAFADGEKIPPVFTCDADDFSPPLHWTGAPAGVKSFALAVDDPDAPTGTHRHWAIYNIPATADTLPQGVPASGGGFTQAMNDSGRAGYSGPCPPPRNGAHHYHFKLFALDTPALGVPAGAKVLAVEQAVEPHVMARAELVGIYER